MRKGIYPDRSGYRYPYPISGGPTFFVNKMLPSVPALGVIATNRLVLWPLSLLAKPTASLPAALDVHPRAAMRILRQDHSHYGVGGV